MRIVSISAPEDKFKFLSLRVLFRKYLRVGADTSAVQDLWCLSLSPYKLSIAKPMLTLPDSAFAMSVLVTLMDISNVKLYLDFDLFSS